MTSEPDRIDSSEDRPVEHGLDDADTVEIERKPRAEEDNNLPGS